MVRVTAHAHADLVALRKKEDETVTDEQEKDLVIAVPLTLARMLASDWEETQTRDELGGGVNAYLWKRADEIEQNDLEFKDSSLRKSWERSRL
jgi:hypothetical protein